MAALTSGKIHSCGHHHQLPHVLINYKEKKQKRERERDMRKCWQKLKILQDPGYN